MIATLESIQLDLMLILSGISAATAFFMALSKSLDRERKIFLILTNICAVLLLFFDRLAYIYRGDVSETGYWMVRISNFIVYTMVLLIVWAFNHYVRDIYSDETGFKKIPLRLRLVDYLVMLGLILLAVSQKTGLYYYFDESNNYHRSPLFLISMAIPCAVLLMQLTVVVQYHKYFRTGLFICNLCIYIRIVHKLGFIEFTIN